MVKQITPPRKENILEVKRALDSFFESMYGVIDMGSKLTTLFPDEAIRQNHLAKRMLKNGAYASILLLNKVWPQGKKASNELKLFASGIEIWFLETYNATTVMGHPDFSTSNKKHLNKLKKWKKNNQPLMIKAIKHAEKAAIIIDSSFEYEAPDWPD